MACQTIAKVLRRSVGEHAPPLTTFQLRYPLIIHAELMTHRVFSRNARSSRAVPTARLIEEVMTDPFIPRYWGANQKGMQASVECNTPVFITRDPGLVVAGEGHLAGGVFGSREEGWLAARDAAVAHAQAFADAGYHKQVTNRLLAPFLHIDVVLTATELANWFALRDDPAAEPHIRDLAVAMREAIEGVTYASFLSKGDWHLPYFQPALNWSGQIVGYRDATEHERCENMMPVPLEQALPASVTRCAQVSYMPFHEAKLSISEEVARHDALISARPMHASPAEHQATPDTLLPDGSWANPHLHGNLRGWIQYRKTLTGESA